MTPKEKANDLIRNVRSNFTMNDGYGYYATSVNIARQIAQEVLHEYGEHVNDTQWSEQNTERFEFWSKVADEFKRR